MIKCIIIDDEPLAREGIANYIKEIEFLDLVGKYEHPLEASKEMAGNMPDLIFLDIQMPKLTGVDFLKTLQNPPMVIIISAYQSYALESFQLDVLDYLLKPVTFQRFFKAANKANDYYRVTSQSSQPENSEDDYFFVKCEYKYEKIKISEILFVEGMQNYVNIVTRSGKHTTLLTLKSIEEKLDPSKFIRVHKSYLVAISAVDSLEGNELEVGKHRIPVSRLYREEVLERVINKKLWKK